MKDRVISHVQAVIKNEYGLEILDIQLSTPPKSNMWDLCFGCFVLAKDVKKAPGVIAQELCELLWQDRYSIPEIEKVEVAGWYINFFLSSQVYADALSSFMHKGIYSDIKNTDNQTIYVDYIWANVWKPLHIGHMCTPAQWQVIINAFKKLNYTVISDSHIWDWGIIFWKLIVWFKLFWDKNLLDENAVEHLFQIYVKVSAAAEEDPSLDQKFRDTFRQLSSWDPDMKSIWAEFTKKSIAAMNILLARLQVYPKYNIGESFYEWLGLAKMEDYPDLKYPMHEIVQELIEKNIATKNDDGSVWVVFPDEMNLPSCILQKRDGTHWYLASDLASVKYRIDNWNPSKILYFVDVRQKLHFEQVFVISRLATWLRENTEITHAYNWFISLKDGAMSTRKWKIIKLESLLDEWEKKAAAIISEKRSDISDQQLKSLSEIISIWAIKYWYLKKSRESDSIFDWDEYMSFEWNSGPYIQYAYVRAQKILLSQKWEISYNNLKFISTQENNLIAHIVSFPEIISELTRHYHPHILCAYVYELTKLFSSVYANIQILSEQDDILRNSRFALLTAFSLILEESFDILGISLPHEM